MLSPWSSLPREIYGGGTLHQGTQKKNSIAIGRGGDERNTANVEGEGLRLKQKKRERRSSGSAADVVADHYRGQEVA